MELPTRRIGNSVGIIFPAALVKSLHLSVGNMFLAEFMSGRLILTQSTKSNYSLGELIDRCDIKAAPPSESLAWISNDVLRKPVK